MGRKEIQQGKNDKEILKALLNTGNHLNEDELERALHLNKLLKNALKMRLKK